jgi:multiple sugar transport system permease protein
VQRFLLLDSTLGYLFLLPALLVILGLVAYPFASAIVMTFQNKTAGAPGRFIGLANYRELLANPVFWRVVFNTAIYTGCGVGLKFFLGLGMALVLNQERRCNNLFRSFLLIPWAIPTVISALNWRWIYDDASGLINNVLVRLNLIDETISWLSNPNLAMGSVIAVVVWQGTPFFTMSFLAGLQAIPKELYEAAEADGAGAMRRFWYVTLPMLKPVLAIVILFSTIFTFSDFNIVQVLTSGGPVNTTHLFATLAYQVGLTGGNLGQGASISLFLFPLLALIVFVQLRYIRKE